MKKRSDLEEKVHEAIPGPAHGLGWPFRTVPQCGPSIQISIFPSEEKKTSLLLHSLIVPRGTLKLIAQDQPSISHPYMHIYINQMCDS